MKMSKSLIVLMTIIAVCLILATGALADTKTTEVDVNIKGGGLHLEIPNLEPIGNITLTKERNSYSVGFDHDFIIRDLTGKQAGWQLSVSATPLTEIKSKYQLPSGSLTIKPPVAISTEPLRPGATLPEIVLGEEKILDAGITTVVNAKQGTGMGSFALSFKDGNAIALHLDALTAKEGTYESTITWNVVTAP